jgi:hypothetical protein
LLLFVDHTLECISALHTILVAQRDVGKPLVPELLCRNLAIAPKVHITEFVWNQGFMRVARRPGVLRSARRKARSSQLSGFTIPGIERRTAAPRYRIPRF